MCNPFWKISSKINKSKILYTNNTYINSNKKFHSIKVIFQKSQSKLCISLLIQHIWSFH